MVKAAYDINCFFFCVEGLAHPGSSSQTLKTVLSLEDQVFNQHHILTINFFKKFEALYVVLTHCHQTS